MDDPAGLGHWAARYEERGFTVLTPGYPGIEAGEAGVAALREDASAIAGVGVREVLDHLTEVIEKLDTPPIIMGHSFGGTFAQLLVGAGLGAAGVSIDGAAVKGVNAMPLSELRSVLPVLKDPANIHRAVPLTAKQFHYAFTNTLDENASQQAYDRYAVPTPARILFQGGFAAVTRRHAATTFDFSDNDRAPLLFVSGGSDHILPPAVQRQNYEEERQALDGGHRPHRLRRPRSLHLRRARLGSRRRLRPGLGTEPAQRSHRHHHRRTLTGSDATR